MALRRLISACARAQPGPDIGYAIASRERRLPLALLITRWAGPEPYHDQPAVRIFVADPERAPLPSAVQIQKQFGLTSAEARVALEIVLAESVSAVAVRLGVGVGTVKTHLVRVFSKTGTRRQSELARLLFAIGHAAQQMIR
jgi:DNA-binding CsgD family transcriptional regulator